MKKIIIFLCAVISAEFATAQIQIESNPNLKKELKKESRLSKSRNSISSESQGTGFQMIQQGQYEEAIQYYREKIANTPAPTSRKNRFSDPFPYYFMGICYSALNNIDSAKTYFNKTLEIDPKFSDVFNEMGLLYLKNGKLNLAKAFFKKYNNTNNNSIVALNNLAYSNILSGNLQQAKYYYKKVASINPRYKNVYCVLGNIYYSENNKDSSLYYFNEAVSATPAYPLVYYYRGMYYLEENELDLAYEDFLRINKLDSTILQNHMFLAYIDIERGNHKKAVSRLYHALRTTYKLNKQEHIKTYQQAEIIELLNVIRQEKLSTSDENLNKKILQKIIMGNADRSKSISSSFSLFPPSSTLGQRFYVYFLHATEELSEKMKELDKLLSMQPNLYTANFLKGKFLFDQENYQEALPYLNRTLESCPTFAKAHYKKGVAHFHLDENKAAIQAIDSAIYYYDNKEDYFINRGRAKYDLNRNREALKDYQKALAINPQSDWALNNEGIVYRILGKLDSARQSLDKAIEIDPEYSMPYYNRGKVYKEKKDYQKAIADFTSTIKLNSDYSWAYKHRADCYVNTEQYQKALSDYAKCLEFDPDWTEVFIIRSIVWRLIDKTDAAISELKTALNLDPNNLKALAYLADIYNIKKNYPKTIELLKKIEKTNNLKGPDCYNMGYAYLKVKKYDKSVKYLRMAINMMPDYMYSYGNLGWVFYLKNDFKKCIKYSKKAINLDSTAYFAMYNHALSTLRLGKIDKARKLYRKYVAVNLKEEEDIYHAAISDLKDLIEKDIKAREAKYILDNILTSKQ